MKRTTQRLLVGLALAGLAAAACGCGSGGGGSDSGSAAAASGAARLTATVESDTAAQQVPGQGTDTVDIVAVDEHGNKVDEATGVTGQFTLDLPWGHDYILIFSDADGLLGSMVYGDREQTRFGVEAGVLTLDLGQITIHKKKRWVKLKNPNRLKSHGHDGEDSGHPGTVTGDAGAGAVLWQTICSQCHGGGLEEGASVRAIAVALQKGKGRAMPSFPELVGNAADIFAYLAGEVPQDADGDGVPDALDACPQVAADTADGCPITEPPPEPVVDTDGDGVPDAQDACPLVAAATPDGCPLPAPVADADGDGVPDAQDACPQIAASTPNGCPVQPARPAALDTSCLGCHGDRSALVSCSNPKWIQHRGTRVTTAVFDEVSTWKTGGVCP